MAMLYQKTYFWKNVLPCRLKGITGNILYWRKSNKRTSLEDLMRLLQSTKKHWDKWVRWHQIEPRIFFYLTNKNLFRAKVNLPLPNIGQREKIHLNFYFHALWCVKPFQEPQRSVKIKLWVNFYFNTTFWNVR